MPRKASYTTNNTPRHTHKLHSQQHPKNNCSETLSPLLLAHVAAPLCQAAPRFPMTLPMLLPMLPIPPLPMWLAVHREIEIEVERPGEAECQRVYDSAPERFRTPPLTQASHILFAPKGDDEAAWQSARDAASAS